MNCKNQIILLFTLILNSCSFISQKEQVLDSYKNVDVKCIASDIKMMKYVDNSIIINVPDIVSQKDYYYYQLLDSIYIVPLETTEKSLIGNSDKTLLINDTLYILDRKKFKNIKYFTIKGKYIGQINAFGNGKGEYIQPTDIFIDDEITIFDQFQHKLLIYDKNGIFIKDKILPFSADQFSKLDKNTYIFRCIDSNNFHIPELLDYNLWITDSTFNIQYKGIYRKKGDWMSFLNYNSIKYANNKIYFNDSFSDTIYHIENKKQIKCPYVLNFGKHISSEAHHNSENFNDNFYDNNFYNLVDYSVCENYVYFTISVKTHCYCYLYSSKSNKIICIDNLLLDKDINFVFNLYGSLGHQNTFIQLVESDYLYNNPNFKDYNKYVGGNYQNIKPDDNPVLIFYKMKEW